MKVMTTILSLVLTSSTVFAEPGIINREIIGGAEVITTESNLSNILDLRITSYEPGTSVARLNTRTGYTLTLQNNVAHPVKLYRGDTLMAGTEPSWDLMRLLWSLGSDVERGCDLSMKLQMRPLKILQIIKGNCR